MQKTILIYPLIACLVLLNSCSDNDGCSEKEPESYPLSQQYKGLICYSGFDTLRFLSEKNETITFIGQGRKDYEYSEIVGSPDCTYKKIYGGQSIRFSNNMGDDVIDCTIIKRIFLVSLAILINFLHAQISVIHYW
jgi:hypothetical protein